MKKSKLIVPTLIFISWSLSVFLLINLLRELVFEFQYFDDIFISYFSKNENWFYNICIALFAIIIGISEALIYILRNRRTKKNYKNRWSITLLEFQKYVLLYICCRMIFLIIALNSANFIIEPGATHYFPYLQYILPPWILVYGWFVKNTLKKHQIISTKKGTIFGLAIVFFYALVLSFSFTPFSDFMREQIQNQSPIYSHHLELPTIQKPIPYKLIKSYPESRILLNSKNEIEWFDHRVQKHDFEEFSDFDIPDFNKLNLVVDRRVTMKQLLPYLEKMQRQRVRFLFFRIFSLEREEKHKTTCLAVVLSDFWSKKNQELIPHWNAFSYVEKPKETAFTSKGEELYFQDKPFEPIKFMSFVKAKKERLRSYFWDISEEISVETYLNQRNKIEQSIDDLRNELAQIKYSKNYHEITRDLKNDINSSIGFHYYERLKN